jgi:hypothetical protein
MSTRYSHTQTGKLLRFATLLPIPFLFGAAVFAHNTRVVAVIGPLMVILAIIGLIFSSLRIEVDANTLTWSFGLGVWTKQIALEEIASVVPARNHWWYGFGIHRTPRGWLYNVSGLDAVEICLRDGRTLRLGTDEPGKLVSALAR